MCFNECQLKLKFLFTYKNIDCHLNFLLPFAALRRLIIF